ncbi:MAG: hypothetical protein ABIJ97_06390 [Bacteroidota bacterium]
MKRTKRKNSQHHSVFLFSTGCSFYAMLVVMMDIYELCSALVVHDFCIAYQSLLNGTSLENLQKHNDAASSMNLFSYKKAPARTNSGPCDGKEAKSSWNSAKCFSNYRNRVIKSKVNINCKVY